MSNESSGQDSFEFLKSMWNSMGFSLPGMVTPTLDVDELGKRIADLKAVEGWLKMNLNMLQMNIQGLEMQRVALVTIQAMGQSAGNPASSASNNAAAGAESLAESFASAALNPALWPWNFMQPTPAADSPPEPKQPAAKGSRRKTAK